MLEEAAFFDSPISDAKMLLSISIYCLQVRHIDVTCQTLLLLLLCCRPKVVYSLFVQSLKLRLPCAFLPAGMVARQLLRTFMADSATAAGVRTSSHAGEKTRNE